MDQTPAESGGARSFIGRDMSSAQTMGRAREKNYSGNNKVTPWGKLRDVVSLL